MHNITRTALLCAACLGLLYAGAWMLGAREREQAAQEARSAAPRAVPPHKRGDPAGDASDMEPEGITGPAVRR